MNGCGNKYAIIKDLNGKLERAYGYGTLSEYISSKIKSDGILVVRKGKETEYRMRVFNPDGTEAEMCGNGIRLFMRYIFDKGMTKERELPIETYDGSITVVPRLNHDKTVTVEMGKGKRRGERTIPLPEREFVGEIVSMGNPHFVIFDDDASEEMAKGYGPSIETYSLFPGKINVEFAKVKPPDEIDLFVWERGAGYTLACGTGACATGLSARRKHLVKNKSVRVNLPGGVLEVRIRPDDTIQMTGPAEYDYESEIDLI
jgi:diaminopimelate epimerase